MERVVDINDFSTDALDQFDQLAASQVMASTSLNNMKDNLSVDRPRQPQIISKQSSIAMVNTSTGPISNSFASPTTSHPPMYLTNSPTTQPGANKHMDIQAGSTTTVDDNCFLQASHYATRGAQFQERYDDLEDEQLGKPGHIPLYRHIYDIYNPKDGPGTKLTSVRYVGGLNCPYHQWPLYNNYQAIKISDEGTWPPPYVNLQDWHIYELYKLDFSTAKLHARWPADFMIDGRIPGKRKPKGRAAKMKYTGGVLYYVVVNGVYQLSGDEGGQTVTLIPPPVECNSDEDIKKHIGPGQECEVQNEFLPETHELLFGTKLERITNTALGRRPLNNRNDWGPLERAVRQKPKRKYNRKGKNGMDAESQAGDDELAVVARASTPDASTPGTMRLTKHPISTPMSIDGAEDIDNNSQLLSRKRAPTSAAKVASIKSLKTTSASTPLGDRDGTIEAEEDWPKTNAYHGQLPGAGDRSPALGYSGLGTPFGSDSEIVMDANKPTVKGTNKSTARAPRAKKPAVTDNEVTIVKVAPKSRGKPAVPCTKKAPLPTMHSGANLSFGASKNAPSEGPALTPANVAKVRSFFQDMTAAARQDLAQATNAANWELLNWRLTSANALLGQVENHMVDWFKKVVDELDATNGDMNANQEQEVVT